MVNDNELHNHCDYGNINLEINIDLNSSSSIIEDIELNNNLGQLSNNLNLNGTPLQECSPHKTLNILKIISWNIQGIGSKLELESIQKLLSEYDVIFLFETMKLDIYEPSFPNYQYFHCQRKYQHPRARRPSGGKAVLIRNSISHLVKIEKANEYVIWLNIKQKQQSPCFVIGGTYIPPMGSKTYLNTNIHDIYHVLQDDIAKFLQVTSLVALCGDFNSRTGGLSDVITHVIGKDANDIMNLNMINAIPMTQPFTRWQTKLRQMKDKTNNAFGKELVQLCQNSNMRIMNGFLNEHNTDDYTCHAPLGKSTVDYILSTEEMSQLITNFTVCPKLVESDHTPLSLTITSKINPIVRNNTQTRSSRQDKRFQYIFEKDKLNDYQKMLKGEFVQGKLINLSETMTADISSDM